MSKERWEEAEKLPHFENPDKYQNELRQQYLSATLPPPTRQFTLGLSDDLNIDQKNTMYSPINLKKEILEFQSKSA